MRNILADLEKIEKHRDENLVKEGYYFLASKDYEASGLTDYKGVKIKYKNFLPKETIIYSNIAFR